MDRLQFLGSIDHGGFVSSDQNIIQFFDHTMAAYNLVGNINDIEVMSNIDSPLSMTFSVSFYTQDQAIRMMERLAMKNGIDLYGKRFMIHAARNNNTLGIQILQA